MDQQSERDTRITVIAGLGNPGKQYQATRHNAGFMVIDRLAEDYSISLQERKFKAAWGTGLIEGCKVLLLKPLTYMNRSGEAVGQTLRYFAIPAEEMLVIHDDLDSPCGRIRLARKGGAGGHRGVLSIIQHVGHQDFSRLKLGIGRPLHREPVEAFVLQPPYPEENKIFEEMIASGGEAVRTVLSAGFAAAMNRFNRREHQTPDLPKDQ